MPFDFPASPTTGQVFNAPTGQGYVYSGTAWNLAQTSPQAPVASDNPPANPYAGQLWLRSTTGALYMWYVDPTSSQWIQIPGVIAPVAPQAWELIQTIDMTGKGSQNFLNLGAFQFLKLTGVVQPASGTTLALRTSTNNGTSFDSGATDYATQSLIATTTSVAGALTSAAQMAITNNVTTFGAFDTLLFNFNKALTMIATTKTMVALGANWATEQYGGTRNSGAPRNALYFGTGGAACSSGTLMLEGVRG